MASRRRHYAAALAGGGIFGVGVAAIESVFAPIRRVAAKPRQIARAARTHPIRAFAITLFLYLYLGAGWRLPYAILGSLVFTGIGVAGWFKYRYMKTGLTVKQAAAQLRLQNRIKERWTKACFAAGITANAMGKGGKAGVVIPPLTKIATDKGDVVARVYPGQYAIATKQVAANLERIADTVGCREVTMRPVSPGVVDLRFCWSNPLDKIVKPSDIRVAPKGTIPFGVTESGEPITIPVLNKDGESEFRSTLIGGVSGGGKSSALWAILAGFIAQEIPVRLRVSDAAGGVELYELGKAMTDGHNTHLFKVHRYAESKAETEKVIKDMLTAMFCRLEDMKTKGVRKHIPTPEEPLDILVIDEVLLLKSILKNGADSDLGQMLSICRKAGFGVIACTQLAEKATLGELRELFPMRMAFRMNTRPQTLTILGDDQADMGPAHNIPRNQQGVGFMYDAVTDGMRKFRATYITDVQTKQIAQGVAPDGMENYGKGEPEPVGEHTLYKFFTKPDRHGGRVLLYVGITNDPARRFREHAADKRWWGKVDQSAIELTRFPDRVSALAAETEAIRSQMPRHNKTSNEDNPTRHLEEVAA